MSIWTWSISIFLTINDVSWRFHYTDVSLERTLHVTYLTLTSIEETIKLEIITGRNYDLMSGLHCRCALFSHYWPILTYCHVFLLDLSKTYITNEGLFFLYLTKLKAAFAVIDRWIHTVLLLQAKRLLLIRICFMSDCWDKSGLYSNLRHCCLQRGVKPPTSRHKN